MAKKLYFGTEKKAGIELGADVFNVANLLNREWGTNKILRNQSLMTIRNFDPVAQEYIYEINPNVGVANPGGTPYQIQISGRVFF